MQFQDTMQAIYCTKYGSPEVLQIKSTKKPIPKLDEILVKIKATAVNSADVRVRSLAVPGVMRIKMSIVLGFSKPQKSIQGTVCFGIVEKFGKKVKLYGPGDEVFGMT